MMNPGKLSLTIKLMIHMLGVRGDQLTLSSQELRMMVSGKEALGMERVFRSGLMAPYMRANGKITELTEKEDLLTLMVIFTRDSG